MPSLVSRLLVLLLKVRGSKRVFSDPDAVRRKVDDAAIRPAPFAPPASCEKQVDIAVDHSSGWPIYYLGPKSGTPRRHGVYIHGGAWINEIVPQQWNMALELVAKAGVALAVPIYPLAPRGTAESVVPRILEMLAALADVHGADRVFAIGDSAGGQIALSAAVLLRDAGVAPLGDTILISPALDLTMANPALDAVEPDDPWLARAGLRAAIDMWRGDLALTDPRVSPIFADLAGLGSLTVFSGTRDITNPDTTRLVQKARAAGVDVTYHEQQDLLHVYPILYGPEARQARRQIVERLSRV